MTVHPPERQARLPVADRVRSTELQTTGAAPPPRRPRSPGGATGRLTTPTVSTHSSHGFRPEAVACTKGMARPEAAASHLIKGVETTGVGSPAGAGEGPGAVGEHHMYDVPTHLISIRIFKMPVHLIQECVSIFFYFIDVAL
jgi:hypothetical protein